MKFEKLELFLKPQKVNFLLISYNVYFRNIPIFLRVKTIKTIYKLSLKHKKEWPKIIKYLLSFFTPFFIKGYSFLL